MHATLKGLVGGVFLLGVSAAPVAAQIEADRPDFTEGTATVPDGAIQLEAGYTYASAGNLTGHQLGEALLRFGLIPGLELRAELPSFQKVNVDAGPLEIDESGWGDASLGMKLGLYDAGIAEGLPSLSLLLGTSLPTGDDDFGADGWEPEAILALGWDFTPSIALGANVGYTQRDPQFGERYDEFTASVALELPVTSGVGAFFEYFAIRPDFEGEPDGTCTFGGGDADCVDGGVTLLLSPTFQVDARLGFNLNGDADEMFFGVGLAKLF